MNLITATRTALGLSQAEFGAWLGERLGRPPIHQPRIAEWEAGTRSPRRSGRSGHIRFEVTKPGLYEFRGFCVGSTPRNWEWSGSAVVTEDGYREASREEAEQIVMELDENGGE